jgi:anti-sigma B factor antagonist
VSGSVVMVHGDIDVATAPALSARLRAAIEHEPGGTVVVDLTDLAFIDSSGLGVLVGALKYARQSRGTVVLTLPTAGLWKIFTLTGLDKVFRIADPAAA